MFPLGELKKTDVRRIAKEAGPAQLRQARLDRHLLHRRAALPRVPEPLPADEARARCARPKAAWWASTSACSFYTIGQRKGVGIGGLKNTAGGRGTCAARTWRRTSSSSCRGTTIRCCSSRTLRAGGPRLGERRSCRGRRAPYSAKTRYRQADADCRIRQRRRGRDLDVEFTAPQWAVTPGQSVVLYQGDACLGGGVIH